MSISVIIPSYNSERFLAKTIHSVLAQEYADWELVIVNDGSRDNTLRIIQEYELKDHRIRGVRQENGGVAAARNRGFAESSNVCEYVIFLDHDDIWEPDTLATLVALLSANPSSPAAYGVSRSIDEDDAPGELSWLEQWHCERRYLDGDRLMTLPLDAPTTFASEMFENRICTMGQVLIRRRALSGFDPVFEPKTAPCDDWDLYLRLALIGDLAFSPQVMLGWRNHASNLSSNRRIMTGREDYIRISYASSPSLSAENSRIARKAYRAWLRSTLRDRIGWAGSCLAKGDLADAAKQLRQASLVCGKIMKNV